MTWTRLKVAKRKSTLSKPQLQWFDKRCPHFARHKHLKKLKQIKLLIRLIKYKEKIYSFNNQKIHSSLSQAAKVSLNEASGEVCNTFAE